MQLVLKRGCVQNYIHLTVVCLKHLLDIVHRDLKLENILLSQPVGNELLNIKVRIL